MPCRRFCRYLGETIGCHHPGCNMSVAEMLSSLRMIQDYDGRFCVRCGPQLHPSVDGSWLLSLPGRCVDNRRKAKIPACPGSQELCVVASARSKCTGAWGVSWKTCMCGLYVLHITEIRIRVYFRALQVHRRRLGLRLGSSSRCL